MGWWRADGDHYLFCYNSTFRNCQFATATLDVDTLVVGCCGTVINYRRG